MVSVALSVPPRREVGKMALAEIRPVVYELIPVSLIRLRLANTCNLKTSLGKIVRLTSTKEKHELALVVWLWLLGRRTDRLRLGAGLTIHI
jgi:hypothetical protein